jgi:plastocyanin
MLVSALSGCGHTQQVGADRTLSVGLTEYRLNPQSAHVGAGTLTLLVRNYGRLTHNLVISMNGQATASTRPLAPGQSTTLTVSLTAGSYQMASTILSDQALGEYGTITVTS